MFRIISQETILAAPALDVNLTSGTFHGITNSNGIDFWFGIPFAQPPIGPLRFKSPTPTTQPLVGIQDASQFGDACPQPASPLVQICANMSKNCLYLNLWHPSGTSADARLPMLVWFYGGVYTINAASDPTYNPGRIINMSVTIEKPIIFVSANYQLKTLGFLASANVPLEDLNASLLDQKAALVFVRENIACPGGDPTKVTIWGHVWVSSGFTVPTLLLMAAQSAGAGSVEAQMLYRSDPILFRAVIADSSVGPL